mmetsp:Transcript_32178/g.46419  ORF Transcript_32178/g.46419 Transcript_32178/m.46419 type:complete len:81 (-) Transcript_32178:1468-1710(-)
MTYYFMSNSGESWLELKQLTECPAGNGHPQDWRGKLFGGGSQKVLVSIQKQSVKITAKYLHFIRGEVTIREMETISAMGG